MMEITQAPGLVMKIQMMNRQIAVRGAKAAVQGRMKTIIIVMTTAAAAAMIIVAVARMTTAGVLTTEAMTIAVAVKIRAEEITVAPGVIVGAEERISELKCAEAKQPPHLFYSL
jgi:hypothetical protein